ncbi:SHOCT domain-containing protein [Paenibacillus pinisoli]|uniref:SHOCT domain-containing protein n=1 Tax=Paenibacillus pinisoli TaxID=1276110 RepID=A0A3A6PEE0_9BACL|nr:SHOCT domain-containing protein [Paenibacillus pinisoli]RJX39045.1 SHOCT domain-containing protein [Paenibacillus pinisoli]
MRGLGIGCSVGVVFGILLIIGIASQNGFLMWVGVIGLGISGLAALILDNKETANLKEKLRIQMEEVVKVNGFKASQTFISEDRETLIAIDESAKKILIVENQNDNSGSELIDGLSKYDYSVFEFGYSEILQSEIIIDGISITKTSRTGQIGGALVGGVLAGGVGAIIGGLGASTSSTDSVNKIQLQIVVNNSKKSFFRITFGYYPEKTTKSTPEYKRDHDNATHWYNIFSFIIQKDNNEISSSQSEGKMQNTSVADELMKLSQLLKEGLITREEYEKQKNKIMEV